MNPAWIREVTALHQQMRAFEDTLKGVDGEIAVEFTGSAMTSGAVSSKRGSVGTSRQFRSIPEATRIVRQLVEDATRTTCPRCRLPLVVIKGVKQCPSLTCRWKEG